MPPHVYFRIRAPSSVLSRPYLRVTFHPTRGHLCRHIFQITHPELSKKIDPTLTARQRHDERVKALSKAFDTHRTTTRFINGYITLCVIVYAAWDWAGEGFSYKAYQLLRTYLPLPDLPSRPFRDILIQNFTIEAGRLSNLGLNLFGHSVSHIVLPHLLCNMFVLRSFGKVLASLLPPSHLIGLCAAGTVTSGVAAVVGEARKRERFEEWRKRWTEWQRRLEDDRKARQRYMPTPEEDAAEEQDMKTGFGPVMSEDELDLAEGDPRPRLIGIESMAQERAMTLSLQRYLDTDEEHKTQPARVDHEDGFVERLLGEESADAKKEAKCLGASGVISGMIAMTACYLPRAQVRFFFAIPMQLWKPVLESVVVEGVMVAAAVPSPFGYSAHLGGMAAGIAYYLLFARRFGGVLYSGTKVVRRFS